MTIRTSVPPPGAGPERQVVHEAPHKKDASSARLEEVLGGQRIGNLDRIKALALIHDPHDHLRGLGKRREFKLDSHALGLIFVVAVLDGVDHRLANGHPDPMHRVVVELRDLAHAVAEDLDQIQHIEVTRKLEADGMSVFRHVGVPYSSVGAHARLRGPSRT